MELAIFACVFWVFKDFYWSVCLQRMASARSPLQQEYMCFELLDVFFRAYGEPIDGEGLLWSVVRKLRLASLSVFFFVMIRRVW
jgi:hypothetical protein